MDNKTASPKGDDEDKKPQVDNDKPEPSEDKPQDKSDQPVEKETSPAEEQTANQETSDRQQQPAEHEDSENSSESDFHQDDSGSGNPADDDLIDDQDGKGQGGGNDQTESHQRTDELIAALNAVSFAVREEASAELKKLDPTMIPYLQDALKKAPSPEVDDRLKTIIETLHARLTHVHSCGTGYVNVKGQLAPHMTGNETITVWTKAPGQDTWIDRTDRAYEPIIISEDGSFMVRGHFNDDSSPKAETIMITVGGREWIKINPSQTSHPGSDCDEHSILLTRKDRMFVR